MTNDHDDEYSEKESRRLNAPVPKQPQIVDRMTDALMKRAFETASSQIKAKAKSSVPAQKRSSRKLGTQVGSPAADDSIPDRGLNGPDATSARNVPDTDIQEGPREEVMSENLPAKPAAMACSVPRETISQQVQAATPGVLIPGPNLPTNGAKPDEGNGTAVAKLIRTGGKNSESPISATEPGLSVVRLTPISRGPATPCRKRYTVPLRGQRTLWECRLCDKEEVAARLIQLTKICKRSKKSRNPRYQQATRLAQLPGYSLVISRRFLADVLAYDVAVQRAWKGLMTELVLVENEAVFDRIFKEAVRWLAKMEAGFARKLS